jgi:hypothetical protein
MADLRVTFNFRPPRKGNTSSEQPVEAPDYPEDGWSSAQIQSFALRLIDVMKSDGDQGPFQWRVRVVETGTEDEQFRPGTVATTLEVKGQSTVTSPRFRFCAASVCELPKDWTEQK